MLECDFSEISHIGRVRSNNEDSYCSIPGLGLWVVADGMGGHEGGEVASAVVISALVKYVRQGKSLLEAVSSANSYLNEAASLGFGSDGMGATVAILRRIEDTFEVAWVGDSRVYLYYNGLSQLTKDHSVVQTLVDSGLLSPSEAMTHPQRHVVTRAIRGGDPSGLLADVVGGKLIPGAIFLLCSDGLTDAITDEQIANIIKSHDSIDDMGSALVDAALDAGGQDNVTVQLVRVSDDEH